MSELPAAFPAQEQENPRNKWLAWLRSGENLVVAFALVAIVLLPLTEAFLRKVFHSGISGAGAFTQHLTLIIGMVGGAIAARDNRLLSLSPIRERLTGQWKNLVDFFCGGVAAAVVVFLCLASRDFILTGIEESDVIANGIHTRTLASFLILGFSLVAVRLVLHASKDWKWRLLTAALTALLIFDCFHPVCAASSLRIPALLILGAATVLGAPIMVTLGGVALILFWGKGEPISSIAASHYSLVTNPSLPTLPLFTLAGFFLAEGGAPKRLVRVFETWFGRLRGGPAIVTALVCAFFTSFTGGSGVTILALGALLMPVLVASRYSERDSLGLLTGAGSLGILFPPCLPLILYAIISTQAHVAVSIEQMFLGGILPGFLLVGLTVAWGVWRSPKDDAKKPPFDVKLAWGALWEAKWELLLPVVALVGLFGGFATPVEAAALTALYAFFVETVIYRDLKFFRDVPRVMADCGLLIGGVLLILGVALGFTNYLVDAEIPARGVEWVTASIKSPWVFLLALNLFLLVVGCLMDIYSAIVVVVPIIVPMGVAFGIDPVHLGVIFLANLELGYLTPPVGMNLFLASYRFKKPMHEVTRAALPMLIVLLIGVLLITYVPWMTTLLPKLFGK